MNKFNSIAVFGLKEKAVSLVLRRAFKSKEFKGPLIIIDYTGRAAISIDNETVKKMNTHPVVWVDLADRYKPTLLVSINQSDHLKIIISELLKSVRTVSGIPFTDQTLNWASEVANIISEDGAINLLVLLQILSNNSSRKWFLDTQVNDQQDLNNLLKAISWSLSFPSVFALSSTSSNYLNIGEILTKKQTLWLEMKMEHFEYKEWQLVCSMTEAAVENAIRNCCGIEKKSMNPITILHFMPPSICSGGLLRWIKPTSTFIRHVGIFAISEKMTPSKIAVQWSKNADYLWIVGKLHLDKENHKIWLLEDQIEKVNEIDAQSVMVRSNLSTQTVVARVKKDDENNLLIQNIKIKRGKTLVRSSVPQMCSAVNFSINLACSSTEIYKKICEKEILRIGWLKVHEGNKQSKGVDNISVEDFKKNLEDELEKLSDELKTHCYKPRALKRIMIKKPDGGERQIGIVSVRDKVVQSAFLYLVEPCFEPHFSHFSFAFRPGRSAKQAVAMVQSKIVAGRKWAVIADIHKCFDSLDHDFLLSQIEYRINEPEIIDLVNSWITVDVINFNDFYPQEIGVTQGSSVSPLLANIYLDQLDKHFERLGIDFVRYADDITLFAENEEESVKFLEIMTSFLKNPLHLELKPAKTNYVSIDCGFDFLGFNVTGKGLSIQSKKPDKTICKLLNYLNIIANIDLPFIERLNAHTRLNSLIRGFRNYFYVSGEKKIKDQFIYLDGQLDQMAFRILPASVRDDPLWICHERFFPEFIEDNEHILNQTAGLYPEKKEANIPAKWMCKDEDNCYVEKNSLIIEQTNLLNKSSKLSETVLNCSGRLSVLTDGGYLSLDGENLIVKKKQKLIYSLPINEIDILYVQGIAMNISVSLQIKLAELDIPVVLSPSTGKSISVLNPVKTKNSYIRGLQVLRRNDHDIINTGLEILSSKVGNQAAVLKYFAKYRKKTNSEFANKLLKAANNLTEISEIINSLDWKQPEIRKMAMGHEGRAASIYWNALSNLVPDGFNFCSRITKGATDVFNQCLNYVYGILYGEIWRALMKNGLDPYFGIVHGSKRDQGSLVFDIIEEFRAPFADRFIFAMIGRGFKPESGDNGMLKNSSKYKLIHGFMKKWTKPLKWRSKIVKPSQIVSIQAASFRNMIESKGKYHPYKMRW